MTALGIRPNVMTEKTSVLSNYSKDSQRNLADEDDTNYEVKWINIIFLPFHPLVKLIMLIIVIVKCILGPIMSVFPAIVCKNLMDSSDYLKLLKFVYSYGDILYGVDTVVYIVHRQVVDEALKREHMAKPILLITVDLISLIPFYKMLINDYCVRPHIWPNICGFSELIVIYRVVEYFSLMTTHKLSWLLVGFFIIVVLFMNSLTCLILLLTSQGLCESCTGDHLFDWRLEVVHKFPEIKDPASLPAYIHGLGIATGYVFKAMPDRTMPKTISEIAMFLICMVSSFIFFYIIIAPKIFAEHMFRLSRYGIFQSRARRIVYSTERRDNSQQGDNSVEKFYSMLWTRFNGIIAMPENALSGLPLCMRNDIRQDLTWPLFYHSPTFRYSSHCFKRYMSERVKLEFKLPGERVFAGAHCYTNLYYLRNGVIQFISLEDTVTPLLSLTSGTLFGDISFFVPPLNRRTLVRCLTYCDFFILSRKDILQALHKFPTDRAEVINLARRRLEHAKAVFACKPNATDMLRCESEGFSWIKKRWWQISKAIAKWRKESSFDESKLLLPPEETTYHCSKYLGQLVLCTKYQLQRKSLFAKTEFPWTLVAHSPFMKAWRIIIQITVYSMMLLMSPIMTQPKVPSWYPYYEITLDGILVLDFIFNLITSTQYETDSTSYSFSSVTLAKLKKYRLYLDLLSTPLLAGFLRTVTPPNYAAICKTNRFIKIYILFCGEFNRWTKKSDVVGIVWYKIFLIYFILNYVVAYILYLLDGFLKFVSITYVFGEEVCSLRDVNCNQNDRGLLYVAINYYLEKAMFFRNPTSRGDIILDITRSWFYVILFLYTDCRFMAAYYVKYRHIVRYHDFVTDTKKHYINLKIHPALLKRLDRYLTCHWKHCNGSDILYRKVLRGEPFDIYWKFHGKVAEEMIGYSKLFAGVNPLLITDLGHAAEFLIVPKRTSLIVFGVFCKSVIWCVHGTITCEYHNEDGELESNITPRGEILAVTSVLLGKSPFRTYTTTTDCEILYISTDNFFQVLNQYPSEKKRILQCIEEFDPVFDEMFVKYIKKHKEYQKKLKQRIFNARQSIISQEITEDEEVTEQKLLSQFSSFVSDPESRWMRNWSLIRVLFIITSILLEVAQNSIGMDIYNHLSVWSGLCSMIAVVDICLKLFLPYYDSRGLLITDSRKCILHYLTRGFLLDIIGLIEPSEVVKTITNTAMISKNIETLINIIARFAHLYIVVGYFNYLADVPSTYSIYILIAKWFVIFFLVMFGAASYFISGCVVYENVKNNGSFRRNFIILNDEKAECISPFYYKLSSPPTREQLYMVCLNSIEMVLRSFVKLSVGPFNFNKSAYGNIFLFVILGIVYWYIRMYSKAMMVLASRSNMIYHQGIKQLKDFLESERVEPHIRKHVLTYFDYVNVRTYGIHASSLMNEKIGFVFKQDINYFFYKKTFKALNTMIHCGETMMRRLSVNSEIEYFLPDSDIMREMDIHKHIYVVHRGRVIITYKGKDVAVLTKGALFGQILDKVPRPVKISARSQEHVDVLKIKTEKFYDIMAKKIRGVLLQYPDTFRDYLALKKPVVENAYNTIQYLTRPTKVIQPPYFKKPVEIETCRWYRRWIEFIWVWLGAATCIIVLLIISVPFKVKMLWLKCLIGFDLLYIVYFVSEMFTMQISVVNNQIIYKYIGIRKFCEPGIYFDIFSLVMPLLTVINYNWYFQLFRLLRLYHFYRFYKTIHKNKIENWSRLLIFKCIFAFLVFHGLACVWMIVSCSYYPHDSFENMINQSVEMINETLDSRDWVDAHRRLRGCIVTDIHDATNETRVLLVKVPRHWQADYLIAMTHVMTIFSETHYELTMTRTNLQILCGIFIRLAVIAMDIWISSITVGGVYTKYRSLYKYDSQVSSLICYLKKNGLCKELLTFVKRYTSLLWKRHGGNWLPSLIYEAPLCLREDVFCSVFLHHLQTPLLFKKLPLYFLRQLAVRVKRVVVFPGNLIVQEGDVTSVIYFIHEGEVEKWYTDIHGDTRLASLLSMNSYFGLIPGLFPNTAYQFSYYSRTVVDLVTLEHDAWQDLLDAYPEIKFRMYAHALRIKRSLYQTKLSHLEKEKHITSF